MLIEFGKDTLYYIYKHKILFAQEKPGQRFHLVDFHDLTPLCNRNFSNWRFITTLSLGRTCKNCKRIVNASKKATFP